MTIDETIETLNKMKEKIGTGDVQIPIVLVGFGENDYIIP